MKNNLSNNDKRLLLFMFLFVIIVGIGYWGIYPQFKAFAKLGTAIDEEQSKKEINEQKINNLVFIEAQCDEYEEKISDDKDRFFDMMNEADIDLMLTSKVISKKLESFNLSIDISETPSQRMAYKYSDLYEKQLQRTSDGNYYVGEDDEIEKDLEDLYNRSGKEAKENEEAEDLETVQSVDLIGQTDKIGANNDIYAARVTMTIGGDRDELEDFLEELSGSDKEILITGFSWSKIKIQKLKDGVEVNEETAALLDASDYTIEEMDSLTINMEIYMCDKD